MKTLTLPSPAKINLHLSILGRRPDGYHNLFMLMEKVSLFDEIIFEKIPSEIELTNALPNVPTEKNLVYRAAKLLQEDTGTSLGVRIGLTKRIPMGGGLGGGSGNAATVLKGCNECWGLHLPVERLASLGAQLGADVPFFLYEGPAQVEGIGDLVTPLKSFPKLWIIIINPGVSVPTPWAYSAWDEKRVGNGLTVENRNVSRARTFGGVLQALHNDFEAVVMPEYPEIKKAKEVLQQAGAAGALMSGSGSAVFGLFETEEARDAAVKKIGRRRKWQIFAVENVGAPGFEPGDGRIKIC